METGTGFIEKAIITVATFGSAALFAVLSIEMLSRGWQSYEAKYVKDAEKSLDDLYLAIPVQYLIYLSFLCFVFVAFVVGSVFSSPVVGVVVGLVAFFVPSITVFLLKRHRARKFVEQLVDALMNMSNALRAGFSLAQSFELIQREMPNPISQEFRLLNQEVRLGVTLEDALEHLYQRMPSDDLDLIITSILISREVGGSLTEVFENISRTMRDRHQIEGKIRALTSQGKLQALVICLMPVAIALGMSWVCPDFMEPMYTTFLGWLMIAAVVILEALGVFFIYKIVNIDV